MRKVYLPAIAVLLAAMGIGLTLGADTAGNPVSSAQVEPSPQFVAGSSDNCNNGACSSNACLSGYACPRCGHVRAGAFNCACRGSYKFPVLPQYTYHWPGMYSQQTMTEYVSPYRFPNLKAPEDEVGLRNPPANETTPPPGKNANTNDKSARKLGASSVK